jgi:ribosomal protein S18 acetylase RimI-like enzyme
MAAAATPGFRAAVEADLPFLVALRKATMAPIFERHGMPALSEEEHRERAGFRLDAATIIEVDGRPVGVVKVLQDGSTWTLEQFQIAPDHQRAGLGTTVLRALIAEARVAGALLRLSVLKHNPAARLYARLGFRTLAESASSYKMTFIESEAPPAGP